MLQCPVRGNQGPAAPSEVQTSEFLSASLALMFAILVNVLRSLTLGGLRRPAEEVTLGSYHEFLCGFGEGVGFPSARALMSSGGPYSSCLSLCF